MQPYVYKLIHNVTGEYYIGVRYANKVDAEYDLGVKYFSSSKVVKLMGFCNFTSSIIMKFDNKIDALEFEAKLITENWGDPLLLNKANKGAKFKNDSPRPQHVKDQLREANLGRKRSPHTDEHKRRIGESNRGKTISNGRKPLSQETKNKMRDSAKGKVYVNNGASTKRIPADSVESFLKENPDWIVGQITQTCPHCNKDFDAGNFSRYHGIKCRHQSPGM